MSAAANITAEPPDDVKAVIEATTADPNLNPAAPVVITDWTEMLRSASRADATEKNAGVQPVKVEEKKEPPKEEKKEPEKKEPEVKQPEVAKVPDPEIKHNAGHFKIVTEARDSALARVKELEAALESAKTTAPPEVATKLSDYEKRVAELQKSEEELRARVREIDITQDPEFRQKYDVKITSGMEEVLGYLVSAGVDKGQATTLVKNWDLRGMADAAADMDEVSKGLMMAAIRDTQRVSQERQQQIKQPEDFATKRRLQIEQQQKQAASQRQELADRILGGMLTATPALKEEKYSGFITSTKERLGRMVRMETSPQELFAMAAEYDLQKMGLEGQHAALVEMNAENEALKKKVADLEAHVKGNNGTLKSEAIQPAGEKEVPFWLAPGGIVVR